MYTMSGVCPDLLGVVGLNHHSAVTTTQAISTTTHNSFYVGKMLHYLHLDYNDGLFLELEKPPLGVHVSVLPGPLGQSGPLRLHCYM